MPSRRTNFRALCGGFILALSLVAIACTLSPQPLPPDANQPGRNADASIRGPSNGGANGANGGGGSTTPTADAGTAPPPPITDTDAATVHDAAVMDGGTDGGGESDGGDGATDAAISDAGDAG